MRHVQDAADEIAEAREGGAGIGGGCNCVHSISSHGSTSDNPARKPLLGAQHPSHFKLARVTRRPPPLMPDLSTP